MFYIAAHLIVNGPIHWENMGCMGGDPREGITITFPLYHRATAIKAHEVIKEVVEEHGIDWLLPLNRSEWLFRCKKFKAFFDDYRDCSWLKGDVVLVMDHDIRSEIVFDKPRDRTFCQFVITPEMVEEQMPKKIFLSHKGADKVLVRQYKDTLELLGFSPWLDEDAMPAGTELERGLMKGFNESCAAVFFVTPNYVDAGYLATEINYAILEKRAKADRFAIVTLVSPGADGKFGEVPPLLRQYVYKTPASQLDGLNEIIRALPIALGQPAWLDT